MVEDEIQRKSDLEVAEATDALPQRPLPPLRFEKEPEPEPKTFIDLLIRLIAA
jgi:hypothetical protein